MALSQTAGGALIPTGLACCVGCLTGRWLDGAGVDGLSLARAGVTSVQISVS